MNKTWSSLREEWLKSTSIPEDDAKWALEAIVSSEDELYEIERRNKDKEDILRKVRNLKRKIKERISLKETDLDDISLNNSNSNKLQLSVPSNINYLLKVWAAAEGRDLSSVAFQCLEAGISEIKSKGAIPLSAIKRYNSACEKRIALAEVNNLLEKYELAQNISD
tara:strand:- start:18115 stop:18612 length:498 start_codon:yes stop_codon:yes gene_type:complete